ncbi:hypothetical protein IAD21_01762 [Abditibacteriota bacterium]|nr:hypothetical protein IAD21_01762 [Abditibacteriota bacterium]
MKKTHRYALVLVPALLSLGAVVFLPQAQNAKYLPLADANGIKNYKKWYRVNPKPLYLDLWTDSLCRLPTPEEVKDAQSNPHRRKFFTIYVNSIGKKAMLTAKNPVFPVGSIIIKEKLLDEKSQKPELLTVMIKRKKGYDSVNGDWEYLVVDGTATKIQGRGKLANCQSCHASQKTTDYVYRTYWHPTPSDAVPR